MSDLAQINLKINTKDAERADEVLSRLEKTSQNLEKRLKNFGAKGAANDLKDLQNNAFKANSTISNLGAKSGLAKISQDATRASKSVSTLGNNLNLLKGLIVSSGLIILGKQLIDVARETQNYHAILKTATGSMDAAVIKFDELNQFATKTPYTLDQTVKGFVKLKNLGLDPTEKNMLSFGNTAAAMGKDLNQMIEAVADASTNEFERLKEFGIKSKKEGDNVTFTFQGIETTIKASSENIQDYLVGIGETNFSSAMADQMDTIAGKESNLEQGFNNLKRAVDELTGVSLGYGVSLDYISTTLNDIAGYISDGSLEADFTTWSKFADDIDDVIDNLSNLLDWFDLLDSEATESSILFSDVFLDFPVWAKAAFDTIVAHADYACQWIISNYKILDLELGKVWVGIGSGFFAVFNGIRVFAAEVGKDIIDGYSEMLKKLSGIAYSAGLTEQATKLMVAGANAKTAAYNLVADANKKAEASAKSYGATLQANNAAILKEKVVLAGAAVARDAVILSANKAVVSAKAEREQQVLMTKEMNKAEKQFMALDREHQNASSTAKAHKKALDSGTASTKAAKTATKTLEQAQKSLVASTQALNKGYASEISSLDRRKLALTETVHELKAYDLAQKSFGKNNLKYTQQQIDEIVNRNKNIISLEAEKKKREEFQKTREAALKTIAETIAEEQRGFPIIKGLTLLESQREFLREKALETQNKILEAEKESYQEVAKRATQIAAITALTVLNTAAIASAELQLDGYSQSQALARLEDEKRIAGLKQVASLNDQLEIQNVRLNQGDKAARLVELTKQYNAELAKTILKREEGLRYKDQEIAAWDTVKDALVDAFETGELKWTSLRDSLLEPLTLDVNLQINEAAGNIQKSIKSVFDSGGGFGDLIKTVKNEVGGLFSSAGTGIGGAINSYQIGSGLASALGANPAEQMGAGIGGAIGNFILPGIGGFLGSALGGIISALSGKSDPNVRLDQGFNTGESAEYAAFGRSSAFGGFGLAESSRRFMSLSDEFRQAVSDMLDVVEQADNSVAKILTDSQITAAVERLKSADLDSGNSGESMELFGSERLKLQLQELGVGINSIVFASGEYEEQLKALNEVIVIQTNVLPLFSDLGFEIGKSAETILNEFKNNDFFSVWVDQYPALALAEAEKQAQDARLVIVHKWGEALKEEGETVSQALIRSAGNFAAVSTMADNMNISTSGATLNGLKLSNMLIELSGGLNEFGSKAEFVYQNFFTAAERELKAKENATNAISAYNAQFDGLDITSRDAFRTIIDGIDLSTEAGVKQYAALLDVAVAVDTLYPELEATATAITATSDALVDFSSSIELFNTQFYTSLEQTAIKVAEASASLNMDELGLNNLDGIRDKFKTLIESLEIGSEAYNSAIKYAEAVDIVADAQEAAAIAAADAASVLASATRAYESYFLDVNHDLDAARAIVAGLGLSVDGLKSSYIALVNSATGAEQDRLIALSGSVSLVIDEENRLRDARIQAASDAAAEQSRLAEELAREQEAIYEAHQQALENVAQLTRELADLQAQLAALDLQISGGGTSPEEAIQALIDAQQITITTHRDSVTAAQAAYTESMRYWEAQQSAAESGREYLNSLLLDASLTNLTPQEQLAEAQSQYQSALSSSDISATQSALQKYLGLARDAYGSTSQYDNILSSTRGSFESLLNSVDGQPQPSDDILNTAQASLQNAESQLEVLRDQLSLAQETASNASLLEQREDLATRIQAKMDELALAKEATQTLIPLNIHDYLDADFQELIDKMADQVTISGDLPNNIQSSLNANLDAIRAATDHTGLDAATNTMREYINSLPDDIREQLDPRLINLVDIREGTATESGQTAAWYVEAIARRTKSNMFNLAELTKWFTGITPHRFDGLIDSRFDTSLDITEQGGESALASKQDAMIAHLSNISTALTSSANGTIIRRLINANDWLTRIQQNLYTQNANWHNSGSGGAINSYALGSRRIMSDHTAVVHKDERWLTAGQNDDITPLLSDYNSGKLFKPPVVIQPKNNNKEQEKTNKLLEMVVSENKESNKKIDELQQEVNKLRAERAQSSGNAENQRNAQINIAVDTQKKQTTERRYGRVV